MLILSTWLTAWHQWRKNKMRGRRPSGESSWGGSNTNTGWPSTLDKTSRWLDLKVAFYKYKFFFTKMQLSCQCQREVLDKLIGHPVHITVDIGYMVLGYMVISAIWSILAWDRFPYTKIYLIYGQISDIWSEIQINWRLKMGMCGPSMIFSVFTETIKV